MKSWRDLAGIKLLGPPAVPEEAVARIDWFIRLRWLAAAGVLVFAVAGQFLLKLQFRIAPLVIIALAMVLYNTAFLFLARRVRERKQRGRGFALFQVGIDLVALTVLMHYGGGIENPLMSYYLFHTIIAAILLPWRHVVLQVLFASVCMSVLTIAEWTGAIHHCHISGFLPLELYANGTYVAMTLFGLITTLCVGAFLAASIAGRLHERERQLAMANEVLAEQDRVKSQYVMRVAHDLAEPAGMITSCLKLVTQGLTGPVSEKVLDMVQRAERKSEYVGHLIRDLLSLSRIKAARDLPKGEVELEEIVNQVFEELRPRAERKSLVLELSLDGSRPTAYGNAEAIHELLTNLVTNAVKYTLVEGRVKVSVSTVDSEVLIEVSDNGVGIPVDAQPHIFDEFYRADNVRAESVEGTGLGLSIVSQILKAHEGRIWLESEEGKGTTFSLVLPVSEQTDGRQDASERTSG